MPSQHERAAQQAALHAILAGEKKVAGKKKRKLRGYEYVARVIGASEGFKIETPRPLKAGDIVKREGLEYRVAYVFAAGAEAHAILHAPKRRPGRPRKAR